MPAHALSSDEGLQDAARSTLRELLTVAKRYRARRQRLDGMFLFGPRDYKRGRVTKSEPKAQVAYDDCPEMELMLKHRDSYDSLSATIDDARVAISNAAKNIDEGDPYTLIKLMSALATLEKQRDYHLIAIQELLSQLSKELMAQEGVLAKIVTEGGKLASASMINRERLMALADANGKGIDSKSDGELDQLAKDIGKRIATGDYVVRNDAGTEEG